MEAAKTPFGFLRFRVCGGRIEEDKPILLGGIPMLTRIPTPIPISTFDRLLEKYSTPGYLIAFLVVTIIGLLSPVIIEYWRLP